MTLPDFLLARYKDREQWIPQPEVEALRRIVEPWRYGADELDWRYGVHSAAHEFVLRALALSYADHPDYDPDWRLQLGG